MSSPKEPRFFSAEFDRGLEYYRKRYFRDYSGEKVVGDAATQHLYLPFVARRIATSTEKPRFAVICRNPVDRLVSNYWHRVSIGLESRSFGEVVDLNLRLLEGGQAFETEHDATLYANVFRRRGDQGLIKDFCFYLEPGYYAQNIEVYRSIFGAERIKILFFEDLHADPEAVTNDLLEFLGLGPVSLPDARRLNEARSRSAARVVRFLGTMPGVDRVSPHLKTSIKQLIGKVLVHGASSKPQISKEERRQLAEHYRLHNRRLSEMTGRSLDHWV